MRLSSLVTPTDATNGIAIDGYNASVTFNTTPQWLGHVYGFYVSVVFGGTVSGSVKAQACNDRERVQGVPDSNLVNWVDITSATANFSAGSPIGLNLSNVMFRWTRLVFTISSGSGVFTSTIQIKAME